MKVSEQRAGQIAGAIFAAIWTWPLLAPASAVVHSQVHPLMPAAVGLVLFFVAYLAVVVDAFNDRPRPLKYSYPVLVLMAALGLALSAWYAPQPRDWLTLLLYVSAAGAALLWRPPLVLAWVGSWSAAILVIGLGYGATLSDLGSLVFSTLMASLLIFTVRRMTALIRELRATQQALADTAVTQERLRFARDLHDLLGHTLSLMVVKAELARRIAPSDGAAAAREAADIEAIGRRALSEVREAVTGYRSLTLATSLVDARSALTDAGIAVTVRGSTDDLPAPVDDAFAWTVREGVTNVIRHSGARRCEIEVTRDGDTAQLTIVDDGLSTVSTASAVESGSGHGLRGLSERLDLLGGSVRTRAGAGGFALFASAPLS
jgi:two-component system sensor histidine kinase DesK